jgi:hypothetical protein
MNENIVQAGALVFGCLQIWLLSLKRHKVNRWGWMAGIAAQPFFLISYIKHGQWGLIVLWSVYSYAILQGIWNHWIKPEKSDDKKSGPDTG